MRSFFNGFIVQVVVFPHSQMNPITLSRENTSTGFRITQLWIYVVISMHVIINHMRVRDFIARWDLNEKRSRSEEFSQLGGWGGGVDLNPWLDSSLIYDYARILISADLEQVWTPGESAVCSNYIEEWGISLACQLGLSQHLARSLSRSLWGSRTLIDDVTVWIIYQKSDKANPTQCRARV